MEVEKLIAVHRNGEELWDAYDPTSQTMIPLGYRNEELAKTWIAGYRCLFRKLQTDFDWKFGEAIGL